MSKRIPMRGSLHNRLYEGAKQPEPVVGMGATISMYTDRHACTIVSVNDKKNRIEVTEDKATRTDNNGMSECQEYTYESRMQPEAHREVYTKRKDGTWVKEGDPINGGQRIILGWKNSYHDYSF